MVTLGGSAMSKSKGNIVEHDEIIQKYGADTARLFILFAAPPEKDLEWNNQGVEGCWRFLNRVWRIVEQNGESKATDSEESKRWLHKTIKRVTEDIERFHFNTAISAIMEYVNFLYTLTPTQTLPPRGGGQGEGDVNPIETLVLLISPFAPHMAEELWKNLGHKDGIIKAAWPKYDSNLIQESKMMIIVQVNGKLRDKLEIDASANEDAVKMAAQELEKIKTFIGGKPAKKVIYVPGKLVNIVI